MTRVLLADDHPIVRDGLKNLISMMPGIHVTAEASDGYEVLESLHKDVFDLLLLDMVMPGPNGVELIGRIRSGANYIPILIVSMCQDVVIVGRAIKAGANGFIHKGATREELSVAIRKTAEGGRYIDFKMAEQLVFMEDSTADEERHKQLTSREFEIFRLLAAGHGVNQIAECLNISNKTVSTHKLHLMEKMRVKCMVDLIKYSVRHRLFE